MWCRILIVWGYVLCLLGTPFGFEWIQQISATCPLYTTWGTGDGGDPMQRQSSAKGENNCQGSSGSTPWTAEFFVGDRPVLYPSICDQRVLGAMGSLQTILSWACSCPQMPYSVGSLWWWCQIYFGWCQGHRDSYEFGDPGSCQLKGAEWYDLKILQLVEHFCWWTLWCGYNQLRLFYCYTDMYFF